ncbi:hypothetical protein TNIN_66631 [Trichonephila inaurata madagascariensis]|uniref:Uncharacterized protein n=1 Tax=Trichonephila inaurata madagascariensis TaxID=2747483 RepID=A0A8X6WZG0_9ARAC|nr:hypothetical protein TNIN_66631 [Trichonephila inaurata madagascariensis]
MGCLQIISQTNCDKKRKEKKIRRCCHPMKNGAIFHPNPGDLSFESTISPRKNCVSSFRDARKRKRTRKAQSSFISVTERQACPYRAVSHQVKKGWKCGDFNAMQLWTRILWHKERSRQEHRKGPVSDVSLVPNLCLEISSTPPPSSLEGTEEGIHKHEDGGAPL